MRKGQCVEVISGCYRWTQVGSLGVVVEGAYKPNGGTAILIKFDHLTSPYEGELVEVNRHHHLYVSANDLKVIPKVIYDIKLKTVSNN